MTTDDKTTITYPETTTMLCHLGPLGGRVLVRADLPGLGEYVAALEARLDEWPGWGQRRKGEPDTHSRGLHTLQVTRLEDGWYMSGWSRLSIMELALVAVGTWRPEITPAREVPRRDAQVVMSAESNDHPDYCECFPCTLKPPRGAPSEHLPHCPCPACQGTSHHE